MRVSECAFNSGKLIFLLCTAYTPCPEPLEETGPPLRTPQQPEVDASLPTAVEATEGGHDSEEPLHFVLPQISIQVANPSCPNWPVSEFVDAAAYKPANEEMDDGMKSYRMNSQPRGLAVIISNKVFTGKLTEREGTDVDAENLCRLFNGLCYDVKLFRDLDAASMMSTLTQVAKLDHRNMDSLVICILTHGVEDKLYGTDGNVVAVDTICKSFNGPSCPTLAGKPKLFLFQACRGERLDYGVEATDSPCDRKKEERLAKAQQQQQQQQQQQRQQQQQQQQQEFEAADRQATKLPAEADVAVVFATVPGYVSWRNSMNGSWFVEAFVEVMTANVDKRHFLEILTLVNNKVSEFQSRDKKCKQIADSNIRFRKLLYFNPPRRI